MARVVSFLLGVLVAVAVPHTARAAGGTLLVMPEGEPNPGLQREIARQLAQQGISVDEFLTASRLDRRVELIGIQPDVLRAACLERIELASWQRDARRVEMLVQTFRGRQALDLVERLEDQLVCLDGVVSRRGLRDLAIHRILAMSLDGAGLMELEQAVTAMRSLGEDLLTPTGLPSEIQSLILDSESRRDTIRVFGGGEGFEVFVDGESLLSGAVLRGQGKHLVQLVEGRTGRVSTAQWVELDRGPVLIWGGEIARNSVWEDVRLLADQGVPSPLLRALTTVLRNTLLVVDLGFRGFRVLHVDGRVLLDSTSQNSRPAPKPVPAATERPSQSREVSQDRVDPAGVRVRATELRTQIDRRFVGGAGVSASFLAVEGESAAEAGILIWGRLWGTGDWGGTLSLGLAQQPQLLEPVEEEFYDRQLHLPIRLGAAWSPKLNPLQPEVSVHVLGKLGHDEVDRLGAGLAVGVLAPVWGLNGFRMRAYSEFGGQWWSSGITVGTEWSFGVGN